MMEQSADVCVLMFSGGRDSTLAAIRLARNWGKLVMVTATGFDLKGINLVKKRLVELSPYLPGNTEWLKIALPKKLLKKPYSQSITCLSCHHSYLSIGVMVAETLNSKNIALGYTGYQSNWIEQTPQAIENLKNIIGSVGLSVVFPVIDINSKEKAIEELRLHGLSEESLEQKCIKQLIDPNLQGNELLEEVNRMGKDFERTLANRQNIHLEIVERVLFDNLRRD